MIKEADVLICPRCSHLAFVHPDPQYSTYCQECPAKLDKEKHLAGRIEFYHDDLEDYIFTDDIE